MKRITTAICGTVAFFALASAVQAQVMGTVVSSDPATSTIVVQTPDGREVVYRTVETTTIRQGDTAVQFRNLQQGTRVQITTDTATTPPPAATGQVVYPIASGIVITPSSQTTVVPVPSAQPQVSAPPQADDDKDTDVDVKVEDDDDDD